MKKSLLTHIALMAIAVVCGYYLAVNLTSWQERITPEKRDLSKAPIAGFQKFASDVKWMFFINYLGSLKTVDDSNLNEVTKRLEDIISNDPNFEAAYKDGVLSLSVADPKKTVELLDRACQNDYLKNNWQIPFYAGFVIAHHVKDPDYNEAAKFFLMAIQRAGDKPENYLINSYLRAKAQAKGSGKDEKFTMLEVLYDEWNKQIASRRDFAMEGAKGPNAAPASIVSDIPSASGIPDLTDRLLKAAQEIKNSEKPTPEMLALVEEIKAKVLVGQHLCVKCLTPYAAGEKFCAKCGAEVSVYGTCSKCGAVVKGDYCSACGTKAKK